MKVVKQSLEQIKLKLQKADLENELQLKSDVNPMLRIAGYVGYRRCEAGRIKPYTPTRGTGRRVPDLGVIPTGFVRCFAQTGLRTSVLSDRRHKESFCDQKKKKDLTQILCAICKGLSYLYV